MPITTYPPDTVLHVPPFQHRLEGDNAIIGDTGRHVFITVPHEGLGILQDLAEGHPIGTSAQRYEQRTGRKVDIDGFVHALESEGFVQSGPEAAVEPAAKGRFIGHMNWITPQVARRIFSTPVLVLMGLLTAALVTMVILEPGILPGFETLQFGRDLAVFTWLTFAFGFTATMLHEVAHVIAARAAGIPSRIRLSNRMFIPVIETDMTGIWLAPKRARYLGFLSGPLLDTASLAILIGFLYAERQGAITMSANALLLLKAVAVTYIGRIYWQAFLFVRTDFYYTLATALGCKDLMTDTQNFIENTWRRLTFRRPHFDQSPLANRERWSVRFFSLLWLIGRGLALMLLFWVTLPILWHYLTLIYDFLTNPATIWSSFDFVTSLLLSVALTAIGLILWGRALTRGVNRRRAARRLRREEAAATTA